MSKIFKSLVGLVALALLGTAIGVPLSIILKHVAESNEDSLAKATRILENNLLIDGHNDLAWMIRDNFENNLESFDLEEITPEKYNLSKSHYTTHTDLKRIREGQLRGQFWSVFGLCSSSGKDATRVYLEQIDIIKRFVRKYSSTFQLVTSSAEMEEAFRRNKLGSMLGMESGHAIDSSMGALRMFYDLGVRYMTLTHNCDVPWATNNLVDNMPNPEQYGGLNDFGRLVVKEMNRLGMIVDIAHTSTKTMEDVLETSKSPVMFSHSSVYKFCKNTRNVKDHVLKKLKANNGILMINFYNFFLTCSENATINDIVQHIDYVKNFIGVEYVGIGADYDGVDRTPVGAEDVSKFPHIFAALLDIGWTEAELVKLAGGNIMRVLKENEQYARSVRHEEPSSAVINKQLLENSEFAESFASCRT